MQPRIPARRLALFTLAFSALSLVQASAQTPCVFAQTARSNTNNGGLRLVSGDFNGDGGVDFAMGGWDAGVYLAMRSNTGTYPLTLPLVSMSSGTQAIAVGDVDGDLDLDLLAGQFPPALRRGNGDGTFQAPVNLTGVPRVRDIQMVDLDQDGDLDLAMALDSPSTGIFTCRNNGTGSFTPWVNMPTTGGGNFRELTHGKFDADNFVDLVLARDEATALFYRGLAGGFFAAPTTIPLPAILTGQVASADMDGDGFRDLVFASTLTVMVLLGDGQGGFSLTHSEDIGNVPLDIALADFDRDGLLDVAATGKFGQVAILRNAGGGMLEPHRLFSGGEDSWALATGDINLDGAPDLACVDLAGMVYLLGDGQGGLRTPEHLRAGEPPGLGYPNVKAERLNGDAFDDVVYCGSGPVVVTRLGDGIGGFLPAVTSPGLPDAWKLRLGHIDTDGIIDLWLVYNSPQRVGSLRGTGTGTFAQLAVASTAFPFRALAAGELTGDGLGDLVVGEYIDNYPNSPLGTRLHVMPGNGNGGFGATIEFVTGYPVTCVLVGDLDGQFNDDVVAFLDHAPVLVALSQGGGTFATHSLAVTMGAPDAKLFDFDGDTDLDMVAIWNGLERFEGDGQGGFTAMPPSPGMTAQQITVADFDGNGALDVVGLDDYRNDLVVMLGDGAGGFTASCRAYSGSTRTESLAALDMENDGMPEVVVAHYGSLSGLTVHPNQFAVGVPRAYCVAKLNSLGCLPAIGAIGNPSASAASGFTVSCTQARNKKAGLLLYGMLGRAALPFGGGTLCVGAPIRRTRVLLSGGSQVGNDCSGVFAIDMNAFARGALGGSPAPALSSVGSVVDCQFWGRDPGFAAPNNVQLSDGLEYLIGP